MRKLLKERIPNDHTKQVNKYYYVDYVFGHKSINAVLDLGCGAGGSIDYFKKKQNDIIWIGLDIDFSAEVQERVKREGGQCIEYDGIHMPFENNYFDLVYTNQAFEHIRYPREVLNEVYRILKSGGFFIGSTSHLEPYHSESFWNFTPYGFSCLIEETGMRVIELRPGIDALTLIIKDGLRQPKLLSQFYYKESPINRAIGVFGKIKGLTIQQINHIKLCFCAQFSFIAQKE